MSHLEHLKSKLDESELLLRKQELLFIEAALTHNALQKEMLRNLGFEERMLGNGRSTWWWHNKHEMFYSEREAMSFAEW